MAKPVHGEWFKIMIIDKTILDNLLEQARLNPRLRTNLDLRTSAEDG